MSASPLQDFQKSLLAGWVDPNGLHHRRPAPSHTAGPWCAPASGVVCSSPSSPQPQRLRTPHRRNNRNVIAPQAKEASMIIDRRKPILMVDPPLFPVEESEDLRNCQQMPAQVLTVNASVKQTEAKIPKCPPPTPSPQRLPTPDIPELESDIFCDCCSNKSTTQNTKEVMVSREKARRKREIVYFGMRLTWSPTGEAQN
ncbi:hypothetical protein GP486_005786 [Trichoglossum hirsutum]|uniref:Uncharacterized protein n=1 Tax=Trichoglossum hirsutum TaxID=265104 RepID=A0A9P8L8I3_9PEZI|nr:hypothetical protein GP486_005786 [Trichoglossum hirsutum]